MAPSTRVSSSSSKASRFSVNVDSDGWLESSASLSSLSIVAEAVAFFCSCSASSSALGFAAQLPVRTMRRGGIGACLDSCAATCGCSFSPVSTCCGWTGPCFSLSDGCVLSSLPAGDNAVSAKVGSIISFFSSRGAAEAFVVEDSHLPCHMATPCSGWRTRDSRLASSRRDSSQKSPTGRFLVSTRSMRYAPLRPLENCLTGLIPRLSSCVRARKGFGCIFQPHSLGGTTLTSPYLLPASSILATKLSKSSNSSIVGRNTGASSCRPCRSPVLAAPLRVRVTLVIAPAFSDPRSKHSSTICKSVCIQSWLLSFSSETSFRSISISRSQFAEPRIVNPES
mmetsp:Transcript_21089/g.41368  ORF Transcript_21089/g.41368 Transcript_21089/m.41368 type:complete len:339 (+) Transcript_21089:2493-3509(+)